MIFVKKFLLKESRVNFLSKKYPVKASAVFPAAMMNDRSIDSGKEEVLFDRKIRTFAANAPSNIPGKIL